MIDMSWKTGVTGLRKAKISPVALMVTAWLVAPGIAHGQTAAPAIAQGNTTMSAPLLGYLEQELVYSMDHLRNDEGIKPYYLAYAVYDETTTVLSASLGAMTREDVSRGRNLNIDLRVGNYKLDNTHQLRDSGRSRESGSGNINLAIDDNEMSIRHALWYHTDRSFRRAAKRLRQVETNLKIKVEEEDKSDDFSKETSNHFLESPAKMNLDPKSWSNRLRKLSAIARDFPYIYSSSITLGTYAGTRYVVNSEGAKLQTVQMRYRISMQAGTKADDGMNLMQSFDFNAASEDGLPDDQKIEAAFRSVLNQVLALRVAPVAEPYIGPAILRNRASGVFFHEIFGHRIEGHRQRDVTEGQTFTKKIGQPVLPTFLSVFDDPTLAKSGGVDLRGYYLYDDEGVKARRVPLVEHGILRTFLLSRTPVEGFPESNGHGRRQSGFAIVSRQANLVVESSKQVSFEELRKRLVESCQKQNKPYGLLFEDISGGFTTTSRQGPQSFKVLPIVVYRVYADGRPDELIRGADIVGTPLTCFETITDTANDTAVFNGSCGAESGWVPVSAVSPSVLISTIEIEKRRRSQSRPPILGPPLPSPDATN